MNLFLAVFNSIFPVFIVILLGYYLFEKKFISTELQKGLNRIAYWIGLPAYLFYKVASAELNIAKTGNLFITVLLGTLAAMFFGYIFLKIGKGSRSAQGAALQASSRGNQAFITLPIIIYSINLIAPGDQSMVDSVIFVMTPLIIIYNFICVIVLVSHSSTKSENLKKDIIEGLYKNPLIISCGLGLLWNYLGIELSSSSALFRTCETLGDAAFPMALLGVGSQLAQIKLKNNIGAVLTCTVVKTLIAPVIGYFIAKALGMNSIETLLALMMLTTPTAVAAYVLADQLDCDPDLTAGTILLSTIFSFFTFSALLIAYTSNT